LALFLRDAATLRNEQRDSEATSPATAARSLFLQSGFRVLVLVNLLVGIVNWAIYGWLPTFLKDQFHLGLGAAGLSATAYIQVASFAGVLAAGTLADRWRRSERRSRALTPAIGYLLAGPFLILAASTNLLFVAIA